MHEAPKVLPVVDDTPKRFVDPEEWSVTDEEVAAGNALGEAIDVDDDEDAG